MWKKLGFAALVPALLCTALAADLARFEDLPAEAQTEFSVFKDKWEVMRPQVMAAWSQWQTLSEEDKNLTRKAMQRWSKMTAAERRQAERNLEKLKRMSPEQQSALINKVAAQAQTNSANESLALDAASARGGRPQPPPGRSIQDIFKGEKGH